MQYIGKTRLPSKKIIQCYYILMKIIKLSVLAWSAGFVVSMTIENLVTRFLLVNVSTEKGFILLKYLYLYRESFLTTGQNIPIPNSVHF